MNYSVLLHTPFYLPNLAIDLNPKNNPAKPSTMSELYDDSIEMGKITNDIVDIFKKYGFKWVVKYLMDFGIHTISK